MSLLNLNKAIKKALSNIAPLDIQNVSLLEANNRVLSNNLKALKSHPPYDNSSMDGYAISFESIKKTLELADLFYESSFASIKEIPFSFRFSILVARRVYRKIGHNILEKKSMHNYNKSGKIYVSNIDKIIQTIFSIYDLIKLSLIKPKEHQRGNEHLTINKEIKQNERI